MTNLTELLERVEKAEGSNRELGDDILLALGWTGWPHKKGGILIPHWQDPDGRNVPTDLRPDPTSSIDAAMALVERCGFEVHSIHFANVAAFAVCKKYPAFFEAMARTPALSLCAALLKALIAMEK